MVDIRNWLLLTEEQVYTGVLEPGVRISGFVHQHPSYNDGDWIITSKVVSINGRSLITQSGSHYYLSGRPSKDWESFLLANNFPIFLGEIIL